MPQVVRHPSPHCLQAVHRIVWPDSSFGQAQVHMPEALRLTLHAGLARGISECAQKTRSRAGASRPLHRPCKGHGAADSGLPARTLGDLPSVRSPPLGVARASQSDLAMQEMSAPKKKSLSSWRPQLHVRER